MALVIKTETILFKGICRVSAKLLSSVTGTTDGEWLNMASIHPVSIHITGVSGDTIQVRGSNATGEPSASEHGEIIGSNVVNDSIVVVDHPVRWLKCRIPSAAGGTVSAFMEGMVG